MSRIRRRGSMPRARFDTRQTRLGSLPLAHPSTQETRHESNLPFRARRRIRARDLDRCASRGPDLPAGARSHVCTTAGRDAAEPLPVSRQGRAGGEYRQLLWLHAAVRGTREAVRPIRGARLHDPRLSVGRLRQPGEGRQQGDRRVLLQHLRREVPDVCEELGGRADRQPAFSSSWRRPRASRRSGTSTSI